MSKNHSNAGKAPSQRQLKVGEMIRRSLSEVLARGEVRDPELGVMSITVGEVQVSADLRIATAYILPLGGKGQVEALAALRRNTTTLRHLVVHGISLKFAPELRFEIDRTFERMEETRRLLSEDRVRRDLED